MNYIRTNRRGFLTSASLGASLLSAASSSLLAAADRPPVWGLKPSKIRLGLVTYNLAKDWDIPTLIKNCEATQFEGVELRTTHAHGVEVALTKEQRAEVKKRFADSKVKLVSLGSAFDYHTPDPTKLRQDINATKDYIALAQDVGAEAVKVRPNALPKEVPKEKTLEQIGLSLRELGEFGAQHNIEIRLEVHGAETSFPPNIKTIMDAANHKQVGVCWNSNLTDLEGQGFDHNFDLLKHKIRVCHITEICREDYPYRRLFSGLNEINFNGFCLAEIPESKEPIRLMQYYRALFLALQQT
jgi:sugar phosphate isomerase/epimerase